MKIPFYINLWLLGFMSWLLGFMSNSFLMRVYGEKSAHDLGIVTVIWCLALVQVVLLSSQLYRICIKLDSEISSD